MITSRIFKNEEKKTNRGPLVLVELSPGRHAKMYKDDALAEGKKIIKTYLAPDKDSSLKAQPMMNPDEIAALRAILMLSKPQRVLEWGSGGSTLYWPLLFTDIEWISIEHDASYAKEVESRKPDHVVLYHLDYPEYYELKDHDIGKFELIIIDGRHRVDCAKRARTLLSDEGVVIVHDVHRERYSPIKTLYEDLEVLIPPDNTKDPRGLWMLSKPKETR